MEENINNNKKNEKNKKNRKFKGKFIVTALLLTALIGTSGMYAYLTDTETKTNVFEIGEIDTKLDEPSFPEEGITNLVPNKVIAKDPTVTNVGENDAYIFVEATVPVKNIVVANEDGTKKAKAPTELFAYTINTNWKEVDTIRNVDANGEGTVTHVYAYAKEDSTLIRVSKSEKVTLFDAIKLVNIVEGQKLELSTQAVKIVSKAIQADDVNGKKTNANEVLAVINNQIPTQYKTTGTYKK